MMAVLPLSRSDSDVWQVTGNPAAGRAADGGTVIATEQDANNRPAAQFITAAAEQDADSRAAAQCMTAAVPLHKPDSHGWPVTGNPAGTAADGRTVTASKQDTTIGWQRSFTQQQHPFPQARLIRLA